MDRGVRQAAHDVLADAEVPAVLVEVGFLDHPIEGRVLASAEGQDEVAERLAAAILAFVRTPDAEGALLTRR
jgi:N-acetylmuramoyl-L-alanine amidase